MYVRNSDHHVTPEHRDAYIKLLTQHARSAKKSLAKRFDVMQALADANFLVTVEVYKDKAAWLQLSPAVTVLTAASKGWLDEARNRTSEAKNLEPTDPEWETAYEGAQPRWPTFGPVYTHNTWTYAQPGQAEKLAHLLVEEIRLAKKMERGIIRFDIYQNLEDPHLLHPYEVWTDQAAHRFHFEQAYLKEFLQTGVPLYDRARMGSTVECRQLEPNDAEWRRGQK